MSVASRLLLILLLVAVVPVGLSVVTALRQHERALEETLAELHHKTAESAAHTAEQWLSRIHGSVGALGRTIRWEILTPEEIAGAQKVAFEQSDDIAAVAVLGARNESVVTTYYDKDTSSRHPIPNAVLQASFAPAVPIDAARADGSFAIGRVLVGPPPIVPVAFVIDGPGREPWTLALAVSLQGVCRELLASSPTGVTTWLLDTSGATICGPPAGPSRAADALTASARASAWTVVVEQPVAQAMASSRNIRRQSLMWIAVGLAVAALAGLVLTRAIRLPLRSLSLAAAAVERGELSHRVPETGKDEFHDLAHAFNKMSAEIQRKNAEIVIWNEELQQRVDDRTRELKDAQEQLLQSKKLGAIAVLGAGIAHEINNPLAAVLGMTQLGLALAGDDVEARERLATVEREALRIREICARMQSLDQEVGTTASARLDVVAILDRAVAGFAERLAAAAIVVRRDYAPEVPKVRGDADQLVTALEQLIDNAIKAMGTGLLGLGVRVIDGELVAISVTDTGRGIPPEFHDKIFEPFFTTKDDWRGNGLGLAVTYRIVEAHNGRIRVSSKIGKGTTMIITLPVARRATHLD